VDAFRSDLNLEIWNIFLWFIPLYRDVGPHPVSPWDTRHLKGAHHGAFFKRPA